MNRLVSLYLLLSLLSSPVVAADYMQLVTGDDYPPFTDSRYVDQGLAPALVRLIIEDMGAELTISTQPWARGYRATLLHEYIATFPYIESAQRQAEMLYSEPLYQTRSVLVVRRDSVIKASKDIAGTTGCYPLGYAVDPRLQQMLDEGRLTIVRPADMKACLSLVDKNRAEFVMVNELLGHKLVDDIGLSPRNFRVVPGLVHSMGHHLIVARDHPDGAAFMTAFNRSLLRLKSRLPYRQIIDHYFSLSPALR